MLDYFSSTYHEALAQFLEAARASGATLRSYRLPDNVGPEGEELATDVASLGNSSARPALMTVSGTRIGVYRRARRWRR